MNNSKPPTTKVLSRRLIAAMAAAMLALGVALGAAIGPAPGTSQASTAQGRFLASTLLPLIVRAKQSQLAAAQAASAEAAAASATSKAPVTTTPSTPVKHRKPQPHIRATPTPAPAPTSETSPTSSSKESGSSGSSPESSSGKQQQKKTSAETGPPAKLPPITHVWLIVLDHASFSDALAKPATAPYLTKTLIPQGTLLSGYKLLAHSELANDVSLLSGQSPNAATEQNCPTYAEVQPPTVATPSGLASGSGCVYPKAVQTLPDELTTAGLTWKAYVEGLNEGTAVTSCRHPALGAADPTAAPNQAYQGFRNPFVYFDSLTESGACASNDVDLGNLAGELAAPAGPPSLSWIVPSACHDGTPTACAAGAPAGLTAADTFLHTILPAILASDAYRTHGLVVIASDAAPTPSESSKPVGALLISPFTNVGARVASPYNQLSILASLERLFGIPLLGHAADTTVKQLGGGVYSSTKKAA
jgi:phosphatidylinositol-3-phosphatase